MMILEYEIPMLWCARPVLKKKRKKEKEKRKKEEGEQNKKRQKEEKRQRRSPPKKKGKKRKKEKAPKKRRPHMAPRLPPRLASTLCKSLQVYCHASSPQLDKIQIAPDRFFNLQWKNEQDSLRHEKVPQTVPDGWNSKPFAR
jgi:hypothetical protein